MFIKVMSTILVVLSILGVGAAAAQEKPMKLESSVQLLKPAESAGEEPALVEATNVVPGDTLVFTTSFRNLGPAAIDDFVIVNPVPTDVVLASDPPAEAQVSIDGAKTWGRLADLAALDPSGEKRPATIDDITHLRWTFGQVPSGKAGQVTFSANVR